MHRTQRFFGQGIAAGDHPGDAKVHDLDRAVFQHHHVMGFNIPVNDALTVGVLQSLGNLNRKVQGLFPVQDSLLFHILLQRNALDQFHDDVIRHNGGRHIVYGHDVGMTEHSNRLALRMEPAAKIFVIFVVIF